MKPTQVSSTSDEHRQAQLDRHIQKIIDAAPPLTPEQRDRLAVLLRGAAS